MRTYHILVVEDNAGDAYIVREAFRVSGYSHELVIVASHEEAKECLDRKPFDLILSDFGTTGQDARPFINYVRTCSPHIPIIVLSGTPDVLSAYDAGACAFVRKASDLDCFLGKIKGIMQFWTETAELPATQKTTLSPRLATQRNTV